MMTSLPRSGPRSPDCRARPLPRQGSRTRRGGRTQIAGFFLIRAKDDRTALEIARTCPHLRYGGSIVIRQIEET
jgi:hypothetical protein